MAIIVRLHTFVASEVPTAAQWNSDIDQLIATVNGLVDNTNVITSGATGLMDLASAQSVSGRKTYTAGLIADELLSVAAAGAGHVKIADIRWDPASGSLANNDAVSYTHLTLPTNREV